MPVHSLGDRGEDPVTSYADSVVAGRIATGRLVRLACERHLRDVAQGAARGLRWDVDEANAAIEFWECCPHLKGRKFAGKPLKLGDWQKFIVGSVYGWKRADGTRRFRVAWVELARKNGKTTLVYPAGLHGLVLDGEPGAEVYSIATKRDQARIVFDLAKRAVSLVPDLAEILQVYAFHIECEETFGKFEAVSADANTLDGLNPSVAICDEVHKWRGRALWDVIETGMGARDQPILWAITTAGEEGEEDVYGQEHSHTEQVLEGVIEDDSRFGFIACLDPGDDWTDPANFVKANPNLGVSVESDEIAGQVAKAKRSPAAANAVKRLRLGIRAQDVDAWIPLPLWDAGKHPGVSWDSLKGMPCFGGLDLASTSDFAALSLLFPLAADLTPAADMMRPAIWAYVFRLWMPQYGRSHREIRLREIAAPWVEAGWVTLTDEDAIDHGVIEAGVIEASKAFDLRGIAYDPTNAAQLATRLQQEGIEVAKFQQGMGSFAAPTQAFEADLLNGITRHDGNPAIRWMVNNVTVVSNAAGHQMPSRKRSSNKIDGVVAAVMARGRAMIPAAPKSFYESNELEVFG